MDSKPFLIFLCLLPALGILVLFLTYPLGLGVWLAFTDATIGRPGKFVGLENYVWLFCDPVFRLAVFNTLFYTILATVGKFALGLWLALLLNNNLPFKSLAARHPAGALDRADRAVGDRLLVDLRPAVLDHLLRPGRRAGLARRPTSTSWARPGTRGCP